MCCFGNIVNIGLKKLDEIDKSGIPLTEISDDATEAEKHKNQLLIGLKAIREIGRRADDRDKISGFRMLRGMKDENIMNAFVHYFLNHLIQHNVWWASRSEERTGKLFTIQDEAFALLVTMNSWGIWEKMASGEKRGRGKLGDTLFTNKVMNINGESLMMKGWNNKGMKEYNNILRYLIQVRNNDEIIEIERSIMMRYRRIDTMRKGKRRRESNDEYILQDREIPLDAYNITFVQV